MKLEALAVAFILLGVVVAVSTGTALAGAVLVAGGAYALILPKFIEPDQPSPQ